MPKFAPPPPLAPETWRALLDAATKFAALKPWKTVSDREVVGVIDPATQETRIGVVLGNAGQIFAAVFYRRAAGLRWILQMLDDPSGWENLDRADELDALKVEFASLSRRSGLLSQPTHERQTVNPRIEGSRGKAS